ncbi:iron-containing alcohol dehydrogenase [Inhella sp. 4Y17]|uniref:Iron-containing alcohol dehydrogenase n=2 Tax=Inhella gelatinilytica TaxID=2795030 RepID=A0A931IWJ3_9BURK|nr:iron-containing alcohol dehydrogenase [Inhella gelatinilytica]
MKGAGKVTRYIPIPQPTLLVGPGSMTRLGELIAGFGHLKLLIVTDAVIAKLGLLKGLTDALESGGTEYAVFDEITPDAPIPLIERGLAFFRDQGCDALIAVGGGSSMDAAKAIAVAAANPKPLRRLAGYFKGRHAPLPLYAVPTTAGTGSEVTVAAVISDPERKDKIVIVDPRIVPRAAALDPTLMTGLPPAVTAATGIDALTHAVEAFIGQWATDYTDGLALTAVGLIFGNLRTAYLEGGNLAAREKMALASTYAGMAFTRANVGYVHAIAHQFGGRYHTPHGLANAIVLPHVLRFSAPAITARLARLAVAARLGEASDRDDELAERFLDAIDQLNADLAIPRTLAALKRSDIASIARGARAEADAGYPVPRYMSQDECVALLKALLPVDGESGAAPAPVAAAKPSSPRKPAAPAPAKSAPKTPAKTPAKKTARKA